MKKIVFIISLLIVFCTSAQYAPAVGQTGSTAISKDSSIIVAWATNYNNYIVGSNVDTTWQHPEKALGVAEGLSGEIVSLGRGGEITLGFAIDIINGDGPDFACFENSFTDNFLELAWVEVSQDGVNFVRFPNYSLTSAPVGTYNDIEPTKITGYCSKYRQGYGTPFDLDDLGLDYIKYVKLIDIIGDSSATDSDGNYIFDPYPTTGSAGADIDAVAVINQNENNAVETNAFLNVVLYPNPAKDFLRIYNLPKSVTSFEIINIVGKQVKTVLNTNEILSIDISNLQKGIYFISFENRTIKFVKI